MEPRIRAIPLVPSLEDLQELVTPVESVQLEIHDKEGGTLPDGLDLILGELTMIALVFTNADLNISSDETKLLNNFRRAILGDDSLPLTSPDYTELCRTFLKIHPDRRLSIDHVPYTVQCLEKYDLEHGTEYAKKAKGIFFRMANAIVKADGEQKSKETTTLLNFKEILYSSDSKRGST